MPSSALFLFNPTNLWLDIIYLYFIGHNQILLALNDKTNPGSKCRVY